MITEQTPEFTTEQISAMSPEIATEALAVLQAKYVANKTTLDKLSAEGIRAMSAADATAALESMRPTNANGKQIPLPPFGGILSSVELDARRSEEAISYLEERGFPARGTPVGDDLWSMIDGKTLVSPEALRAAEAKLKQLQSDKGWVDRLFTGDQQATREFHLANGIITAGIIQSDKYLWQRTP